MFVISDQLDLYLTMCVLLFGCFFAIWCVNSGVRRAFWFLPVIVRVIFNIIYCLFKPFIIVFSYFFYLIGYVVIHIICVVNIALHHLLQLIKTNVSISQDNAPLSAPPIVKPDGTPTPMDVTSYRPILDLAQQPIRSYAHISKRSQDRNILRDRQYKHGEKVYYRTLLNSAVKKYRNFLTTIDNHHLVDVYDFNYSIQPDNTISSRTLRWMLRAFKKRIDDEPEFRMVLERQLLYQAVGRLNVNPQAAYDRTVDPPRRLPSLSYVLSLIGIRMQKYNL